MLPYAAAGGNHWSKPAGSVMGEGQAGTGIGQSDSHQPTAKPFVKVLSDSKGIRSISHIPWKGDWPLGGHFSVSQSVWYPASGKRTPDGPRLLVSKLCWDTLLRSGLITKGRGKIWLSTLQVWRELQMAPLPRGLNCFSSDKAPARNSSFASSICPSACASTPLSTGNVWPLFAHANERNRKHHTICQASLCHKCILLRWRGSVFHRPCLTNGLNIELFYNSESCCPVGKQQKGKEKRTCWHNALSTYSVRSRLEEK